VKNNTILKNNFTHAYDRDGTAWRRLSTRLLPLGLMTPLLGACAGGYPPPPGYPEIVFVMPGPSAARGFSAGPTTALYTTTPDNRDEVLPPSPVSPRRDNVAPPPSSVVQPDPRSATATPPRGDVRVPPDREANASPRSPTCGYWRLGCGILWK
jgi:hypothetical protein